MLLTTIAKEPIVIKLMVKLIIVKINKISTKLVIVINGQKLKLNHVRQANMPNG